MAYHFENIKLEKLRLLRPYIPFSSLMFSK